MSLTLGIQYLSGYAVASDAARRDMPEWPPHPARVYMALAAAYFTDGDSRQAFRATLEWLERLPPPVVMGAPRSPRDSVTHYVPVNDKTDPRTAGSLQSAPGLMRGRQPRTFPRVFVGDAPAYLFWPDVQLDSRRLTMLDSLCERVTRVGHSSSLVQMWATTDPPVGGCVWEPNEGAATDHLRIPSEGLLDRLVQLYGAEERAQFFSMREQAESARGVQRAALRRSLRAVYPAGPPAPVHPVIGLSHGYRLVPLGEKAVPWTTIFEPGLIVHRLVPEDRIRRADLTTTLYITDVLRRAILKEAAKDGAIPEWLSGHGIGGGPTLHPHVAYFPLGFVGMRHADAHVLGIAVAVPRELSLKDQRWLRHVVASVERLTLGPLGVWRLESREPGFGKTLRDATWTAAPGGAKRWASVTPVVFDRHAKSRQYEHHVRETACSVHEAFARVGLQDVADIEVSPFSAHEGVPPVHEFPRCPRPDGSLRRHAHVVVSFAHRVVGPVAIGAGRFRGYGFFKPLPDEAN